jgi:hypothetical protein
MCGTSERVCDICKYLLYFTKQYHFAFVSGILNGAKKNQEMLLDADAVARPKFSQHYLRHFRLRQVLAPNWTRPR